MREVKYSEPVTVDEAVATLTSEQESKCLAGGASLVAMMNARLVEPLMLVSLRGISELNGIEQGIDGSVRIGAGVHHCEIAATEQLVAGHAVVQQAAAVIANPVIRAMGTLGGLVAHCDPAADVLAALVALDAEIEIAGKESRRKMSATDFFIDWYTTALEHGELITAVYLPPPPVGSIGVYDKFAKIQGDMGIVMVAVVLAKEKGLFSHLAVSISGCGPIPIRLPEKEHEFIGSQYNASAIKKLGEALAAVSDPVDDVRSSSAYRRQLIPRIVCRAVHKAHCQLEEG